MSSPIPLSFFCYHECLCHLLTKNTIMVWLIGQSIEDSSFLSVFFVVDCWLNLNKQKPKVDSVWVPLPSPKDQMMVLFYWLFGCSINQFFLLYCCCWLLNINGNQKGWLVCSFNQSIMWLDQQNKSLVALILIDCYFPFFYMIETTTSSTNWPINQSNQSNHLISLPMPLTKK